MQTDDAPGAKVWHRLRLQSNSILHGSLPYKVDTDSSLVAIDCPPLGLIAKRDIDAGHFIAQAFEVPLPSQIDETNVLDYGLADLSLSKQSATQITSLVFGVSRLQNVRIVKQTMTLRIQPDNVA